MSNIVSPQQWDTEFEDRLFQEVAWRHQPGLPQKRASGPRDISAPHEREATAEYWRRIAAHDSFIVQAASGVIGTVIDEIGFQLVLSRQIGDDGAHAEIAAERARTLSGEDPWRRINEYVSAYWERLGDLPVRSLTGFIAFELHLEVYILAKQALRKRTGSITDASVREVAEKIIVPDETAHRLGIVRWWLEYLHGLAPSRRDSVVDQLLRDDNEFQRRHNSYLRLSYEVDAQANGTDISHAAAIYDDFRREVLARLTGRRAESLSALVHYND